MVAWAESRAATRAQITVPRESTAALSTSTRKEWRLLRDASLG